MSHCGSCWPCKGCKKCIDCDGLTKGCPVCDEIAKERDKKLVSWYYRNGYPL